MIGRAPARAAPAALASAALRRGRARPGARGRRRDAEVPQPITLRPREPGRNAVGGGERAADVPAHADAAQHDRPSPRDRTLGRREPRVDQPRPGEHSSGRARRIGPGRARADRRRTLEPGDDRDRRRGHRRGPRCAACPAPAAARAAVARRCADRRILVVRRRYDGRLGRPVAGVRRRPEPSSPLVRAECRDRDRARGRQYLHDSPPGAARCRARARGDTGFGRQVDRYRARCGRRDHGLRCGGAAARRRRVAGARARAPRSRDDLAAGRARGRACRIRGGRALSRGHRVPPHRGCAGFGTGRVRPRAPQPVGEREPREPCAVRDALPRGRGTSGRRRVPTSSRR